MCRISARVDTQPHFRTFKMKVFLLAAIALSAMSTVSCWTSLAGWYNEDGVGYPGDNVKRELWKPYDSNLKDAEECRSQCQKFAEAKFFTFNKDTGNCFCKTKIGEEGRQKRPEWYSGTVLDQDRINYSTLCFIPSSVNHIMAKRDNEKISFRCICDKVPLFFNHGLFLLS